MTLRIAYGRIAQETNAITALTSGVADFRRTHFLEGGALSDACRRRTFEAPGLLRNGELSGFVQSLRRERDVVLVPLFSAWAIPGGPLTAEARAWFTARLTQALHDAGPLDAVYLSMHGAMSAEDTDDPEGAWLALVKQITGAHVAVSFDLHAQLTPAKVQSAEVLVGYHTNPHRDHAGTGRRAARALLATLRGAQPTTTWRSLPMVLGGGTTLDFLQPMRPIFRRMRQMERMRGVLSVSLFQAHIWHDAPDLGWSTHVTTDGDPDLADRLATELADACWRVRDQLPPAFPDPTQAIAMARQARLARRLGTICMSDASDLVGAGAPGSSTHLLRALLTQATDLLSYVPLRDPDAVAALWTTPLGAPVQMAVGGTLDPTSGQPVWVTGTLRARKDIPGIGPTVALDLGHVQLVITDGPPLAMKPSFYRTLGLLPLQADVCVVKSLFPFRLYFALHNRLTIYVRTQGPTDFDVWRRATYARPVHPRDTVTSWRPHGADAPRRPTV